MPEAISDNHERLVKKMIYLGLNFYFVNSIICFCSKGTRLNRTVSAFHKNKK